MSKLYVNSYNTQVSTLNNSIDIVNEGLAGINKTNVKDGYYNKISTGSKISLKVDDTTTNSHRLLPTIVINSAKWDSDSTVLTLSITEVNTIPEQYIILLWSDNKEHFPYSIGAKSNLNNTNFDNDDVFPNMNNYGMASVFPNTEWKPILTKGTTETYSLEWNMNNYKYGYCTPDNFNNDLPTYDNPNGIIVPRRVAVMVYDGLLIREINSERLGTNKPVYWSMPFNQNINNFKENSGLNPFQGNPNNQNCGSNKEACRSPQFLGLENIDTFGSQARNNTPTSENSFKTNIFLPYSSDSIKKEGQYYYTGIFRKSTHKYSYDIMPSYGFNTTTKFKTSNMSGVTNAFTADPCLYISVPLVSNPCGVSYSDNKWKYNVFNTSDENTQSNDLTKQVYGTKEVIDVSYIKTTGAITINLKNGLSNENIYVCHDYNNVLEHILKLKNGNNVTNTIIDSKILNNKIGKLYTFTGRNFISTDSINNNLNTVFIYTPSFTHSGCGWNSHNIYWVNVNYTYLIRINNTITDNNHGIFILSEIRVNDNIPSNTKTLDTIHNCNLKDIAQLKKPDSYPSTGDWPVDVPYLNIDGGGWVGLDSSFDVSNLKIKPSVLSLTMI